MRSTSPSRSGLSTGPSVSSISSKAALEQAPVQRRLLAVVIGRQKRTPSEALTGTVVIKPIKGTPAWPPAQPSA